MGLFLLLCTLQFFMKFGLVIVSVTALSTTYSLVFLPALLMAVGPTKHCCAFLGVAEEGDVESGAARAGGREAGGESDGEDCLPPPDSLPPLPGPPFAIEGLLFDEEDV